MLPISLIIVGILSRLIVHVPNYTPVLSVALFSGVYLNKRYAIAAPLMLMIVSDLILGWHDTIAYTWGSMVLIALIGVWGKNYKNIAFVVVASVISSILFFVVTNFGSWLVLYPRTLRGFVECYAAAIPFFKSTLVSTLLYSCAMFGVYELVASRVRNTRLAGIFLSA